MPGHQLALKIIAQQLLNIIVKEIRCFLETAGVKNGNDCYAYLSKEYLKAAVQKAWHVRI